MRSVPTLFVASENAMVYTNWSCFNGSIKLHSPLKIGGVPPLAGRGYEMKLKVNYYIIPQIKIF